MDVNVNLSFIYVLICFLLIYFVAKRTIFARLDAILGERRALIEGSRQTASDHDAFIEQSRAEINARLAEARARAYASKQELREEAIARQGSIVDAARKQAGEKVAGAQQELETAVADAREHLQRESDALAADIVNSLIRRTA
jgi:F-type H+-transporting ATPase subunit b